MFGPLSGGLRGEEAFDFCAQVVEIRPEVDSCALVKSVGSIPARDGSFHVGPDSGCLIEGEWEYGIVDPDPYFHLCPPF